MGAAFEFHGDEFLKQLSEVKKLYPDSAEAFLRKTANKLKKRAIEKTPTGKAGSSKHSLKKSYHISNTKQQGKDIFIEFYSSSPHYHLVERGHEIVGKDGKVTGFVQGVYMVERSVTEIQRDMPGEAREWLDKLMEEVE